MWEEIKKFQVAFRILPLAGTVNWMAEDVIRRSELTVTYVTGKDREKMVGPVGLEPTTDRLWVGFYDS